ELSWPASVVDHHDETAARSPELPGVGDLQDAGGRAGRLDAIRVPGVVGEDLDLVALRGDLELVGVAQVDGRVARLVVRPGQLPAPAEPDDVAPLLDDALSFERAL